MSWLGGASRYSSTTHGSRLVSPNVDILYLSLFVFLDKFHHRKMCGIALKMAARTADAWALWTKATEYSYVSTWRGRDHVDSGERDRGRQRQKHTHKRERKRQ